MAQCIYSGADTWGGFDNGNSIPGLQHQGSTRADKEGSVKGRHEGSTKGGDKDGSTRVERDGSTKGGKPTTQRRKSGHLDSKVPVPKLFWLSEKPKRSFRGHTGDVLDVSWSESKVLLNLEFIFWITVGYCLLVIVAAAFREK